MALIDCKECGKQVSDQAKICPNCGAPPDAANRTAQPVERPSSTSGLTKFLGVIVLLILVGILYVFYAGARGPLQQNPIVAAIAPLKPTKIADETVQLNETQYKYFTFSFGREGKVDLNVRSNPKDVDVMLMSQEQFAFFQQNYGKPGVTYQFTRGLSSQKVMSFNQSATLPPGLWSIVVLRPKEAILFQDPTNVAIAATVWQ
jgi:hypothetical protein